MLKKILFTAFMLATLFGASAQKWKPYEDRMKENNRFTKYDYVNLYDSTSVTVDNNGSGTFGIYKTIKINTPQGAMDNRVIVFDYDPLTAFAKFRYVTIYKAGGDVINLDITKANDYTAPARAIYWGARQIMMEVGYLEPGDVLDYAIDKKGFTYALLAADDSDRFIPPMRGHFYDIVPFWSSYPTVTKIHRVSLPKDKPLQYQFYQGEVAVSVRDHVNTMIYKFRKDNLFPIQRESAMVDFFDAAPKLFMSSTPKWKDKSLWFNKVNEDYGSFNAYEPAQKKVDEIIKGKKTEMEKIAALTHWVADNIRYSGISMGEGEGFTLHNTKMNFTDRCGVCKDIAGTLISMLRMAGFESYPAMTMAGSRVERIPADHFNHCVAVVKLSDGTYIPLDPTWVPFTRELWSSAEQQQNYLPGTPEGSDLQITPISNPENHYFRLKSNNHLDQNGNLYGTIIVEGEGQTDSGIRRIFTNGTQKLWKQYLEAQILAIAPQAKMISVRYNKNPKDYQAEPIHIEFKYEIPNYAIKTTDGKMLYKPITMSNFYGSIRSYLRINTNPEKRTYGFKDRTSRLVEFNETVRLPKGYEVIDKPESYKDRSDAADFDASVTSNRSSLQINQRLALKKRVYETKDWQGFRTAVNHHKEYGNYLILQKQN